MKVSTRTYVKREAKGTHLGLEVELVVAKRQSSARSAFGRHSRAVFFPTPPKLPRPRDARRPCLP